MRINSQYSAPFGDNTVLPEGFKNPYPIEDKEMRTENTILKFDLNKKIMNPLIKPYENKVAKGTPLELSYPDTEEQDIFFRYTLDESLPTYFSGIKYESNNPFKIDNDCKLKICACKYGFMDSEIITVSYNVQEGIVYFKIFLNL